MPPKRRYRTRGSGTVSFRRNDRNRRWEARYWSGAKRRQRYFYTRAEAEWFLDLMVFRDIWLREIRLYLWIALQRRLVDNCLTER